MSFHNLVAHFFSALVTTPQPLCNTVCLAFLRRRSWLLPLLAIMVNKAAIKHLCAGFHPGTNFQVLWDLLDHMFKVCWSCNKVPNCFPKWRHHCPLLLAVKESSCYSTCSPAFRVVSSTDSSHTSKCVVVSPCFRCISLKSYEVKHLSMCLFSIYVSSVVRCLMSYLVHVLNALLISSLLNFKSPLYILDNSSSSDISFANLFYQSVTCLLTLLTVSSCRGEVLNFNGVQLVSSFFHRSSLWCCI